MDKPKRWNSDGWIVEPRDDGYWYPADEMNAWLAELAKRVLPYIEAYRRYCLENLLNVNDYKGANEIIAELEELAEGNDG